MASTEADLNFIRKLLKASNRSHSEPLTMNIGTRFTLGRADPPEANGRCGDWLAST